MEVKADSMQLGSDQRSHSPGIDNLCNSTNHF